MSPAVQGKYVDFQCSPLTSAKLPLADVIDGFGQAPPWRKLDDLSASRTIREIGRTFELPKHILHGVMSLKYVRQSHVVDGEQGLPG